MEPESGFIPTPAYGTISGHAVMQLAVPGTGGILAHQVRMLEAQAVPGLLPLTCESHAGGVLLTWRVSACQPLSALLERRPLGVSEMMRLIRPLPDLFERMESLLLDVDRLELDCRYIQYEPVCGELLFAYRPLADHPAPRDHVRNALRRWFLEGCRTLGPSDARLLSDLLHLLENPAFHWGCLRNLFTRQVTELVRPDGSASRGTAFDADPFGGHASSGDTSCGMGRREAPGSPSGSRKGSSPCDRSAERPHAARGTSIPGGVAQVGTVPPDRSGQAHPPGREKQGRDSRRTGRFAKAAALQGVLLLTVLCARSAGVLSLQGPDGDMARAGLLVVGLAIEMLTVTGLRGRSENAAAEPAAGGQAPARSRPSAGLRIQEGRMPLMKTGNQEEEALREGPRAASCMPGEKPEPPGPWMTPDLSRKDAHAPEPATGNTALMLLEREGEAGGTAFKEALPAMCRSPYVVGRLREQVDGWLAHPAVGKLHAEIRKTTSGYAVCDLNSRNGTRVNGLRIEPYLPHAIGEGDRICFAGESFRIRLHPVTTPAGCDAGLEDGTGG